MIDVVVLANVFYTIQVTFILLLQVFDDNLKVGLLAPVAKNKLKFYHYIVI